YFFDSLLIHRGFNGSILVAKDGAIVYEKYVGYGDLRKKDALTDSTALHIASTGKTLTAMAVLRLVQENKLSLDDSIQQFFPSFPYEGVTVKMLMSHRSGLPNYLYFLEADKNYKNQYVTNNDVLEYLITKKPNRSFKPGTRFSYSNTNFVMLALIIEKISGQSFAAFMKEKIFGPLQMNDTYVYSLADSATAIHSFNYNNTLWQNDRMEGTAGDKNIYSTPKDLLKWDQALYTDQFLRKTLLDSAFTPYSLERPSVHNYGLGWRMLLLPNGKKVIYHFGRWHGFNAAFARLTDEKVTIIILGNKFNRNIYSTANKAYDIFGNYDRSRNSGNDEDDDDNEKTKLQKVMLSKFGSADLAQKDPKKAETIETSLATKPAEARKAF
ncbi:MAG TPA: serine hydrolase domain-containing protein, partial [Chitinophagaceae bacterium]|nr:serine hydrolase domain-containing protein [Chitinophagaceae bacterium]